MPKNDDDGEEIENSVITNSVESLISLTERCSISETQGYYNFSTATSYKFQYVLVSDRRDNNEMVHSLYTFIATLLLYNELDVVHVNVGEDMYEFNIDDLGKLQFTLDKLLFDKVEEV